MPAPPQSHPKIHKKHILHDFPTNDRAELAYGATLVGSGQGGGQGPHAHLRARTRISNGGSSILVLGRRAQGAGSRFVRCRRRPAAPRGGGAPASVPRTLLPPERFHLAKNQPKDGGLPPPDPPPNFFRLPAVLFPVSLFCAPARTPNSQLRRPLAPLAVWRCEAPTRPTAEWPQLLLPPSSFLLFPI